MNRHTGTIRFSDSALGYGFISLGAGQADVYFSHLQLLGDAPNAPQKGDMVTFDLVRGVRGHQALDICVVGDSASEAAYEAWMTPERQRARQEHADTEARYLFYFKHLKRRGTDDEI